MPRRALVVGRFQPPHRGHLACFQAAADLADEVVAVVGSAQRSHTLRDPFTAGERLEMLGLLAEDSGVSIPWRIPVADLGQYHLWVAHVAAHVPAFDVVVGGNPLTLSLFEAAGYAVHPVDLKKRSEWSGTEVRRRLLEGAPAEDAVTPGVQRFLSSDAIRARFRAIRATTAQESG